MTDVSGRTAFITGGANGIGLGIARAFAGAGAKLVLADLDAEALGRARTELSARAPTEVFQLDVREAALEPAPHPTGDQHADSDNEDRGDDPRPEAQGEIDTLILQMLNGLDGIVHRIAHRCSPAAGVNDDVG